MDNFFLALVILSTNRVFLCRVPSFLKIFNLFSTKTIVQKIILGISLLSIISFTSYYLFNGSFIKLWVGKEFFLGNTITAIIAIGIALRIILNYGMDIIFGYGFIKYSSMLLFYEGIIRTVLMVVLLLLFGVSGAALGLLISCLIFLMVIYFKFKDKFGLRVGSERRSYKILPAYILYVILFVSIVKMNNITVNSWPHVFYLGSFTLIFLTIPLVFNRSIRKVFIDR